jgi:hypothetical protein
MTEYSLQQVPLRTETYQCRRSKTLLIQKSNHKSEVMIAIA